MKVSGLNLGLINGKKKYSSEVKLVTVKNIGGFSMVKIAFVTLVATALAFSFWPTTDLQAAASEKPLASKPKVDAFDQAAMDAVKDKLESNLTGLPVDEIKPSPVPSLFEITSGSDIYYVTKDGNHLISGRLLSIKNGIVDLTQQSKQKASARLSPYRKSIVDKIKDEDTFIYRALNEKHRINVFVDVDCGYCRKLHKEIPELNDMGVTVRYLAYPRAGLSSSSAAKLISAFCADDKNSVINDAFASRPIPPKSCKNPVAYQYSLVRKFGINGTPNIIFANGDLWPGYLDAKGTLKEIEKRGL